MKKVINFLIICLSVVTFSSCSENYSNGERIGIITQFSHKGIFWKSWEGHLNVTQTGMNTANSFDFSIDNDKQDEALVKTIDSAAIHGWKVKLVYHEVSGFNWFQNRGHTDHFIEKCVILERHFNTGFGNYDPTGPSTVFANGGVVDSARRGRVVDTIYVVIMPKR